MRAQTIGGPATARERYRAESSDVRRARRAMKIEDACREHNRQQEARYRLTLTPRQRYREDSARVRSAASWVRRQIERRKAAEIARLRAELQEEAAP